MAKIHLITNTGEHLPLSVLIVPTIAAPIYRDLSRFRIVVATRDRDESRNIVWGLNLCMSEVNL